MLRANRADAASGPNGELSGTAAEPDPDDHHMNVDLGYLTDGVAACLASLRDRLRQTQADLLTVPAQELRSAIAVRSLCCLGTLSDMSIISKTRGSACRIDAVQ